MSTRHDDPQFHRDCHWYNGEAHPDDVRRPKDIRWLVYYIIGLCAIAVALMWAGSAQAATVTIDTAAYQINLGTRNKIYFSRIGSVPLGVACIDTMPALDAFVIADRMKVTLSAGRTSRPNQIFAKCGTPPPPPPPPPPVASLQVYACADAGADSRILESATVLWPNCATATYQNPSRSLVVATNDDGVLLWRLASKVTTGRVGTQTGTTFAWTPVGDIPWGTPPPATGTAPLTWTKPTTNVDGTMLTTLSGYRIYYGPSPTLLAVTIDINNPATLAYTVPNLTSGTWHFAIKSLTPTQESALSNTVAVTLP